MPNLTWLDLDNIFNETVNDVMRLLGVCGARLLTLNLQTWFYYDLNIDIGSILALCPNLTTFSFNIEWHLQGPIVTSPHQKLSYIGLHSSNTLFYVPEDEEDPAFWVFHEQADRLRPDVVDSMSMLGKSNFPNLCSIRIMPIIFSTYCLRRGGMDALDVSKSAAWIELCQRCAAEGIRLEDVTGHDFGIPPSFPNVQGPLVYADD